MRFQNSHGASFGAQPSSYLGTENQWETKEKLASDCNVRLKEKKKVECEAEVPVLKPTEQ